LVRVAIGPITLGDSQPGEWRELTKEERAGLDLREVPGWSEPSIGE
jgi:16S rRNA U516 pseudouridylate synthase RsuA-like enzyme